MNMSTMPGFTALETLPESTARYRSLLTPGRLPNSGQVSPQLSIGFCMADCDASYGDDYLSGMICKFNCLDDGGGGSGGGGSAGGTGGTAGGHALAVLCLKCKAACNRLPSSKRADCVDNCSDLC
jgi:hypothetical protein